MNQPLILYIHSQIEKAGEKSLPQIQTPYFFKRNTDENFQNNSNGPTDANLFNPNELPFIDPEQV